MGNALICCATKQPGTKKGARIEPRDIEFPSEDQLDASKWKFPEISYGGSYHYSSKPEIEEVSGLIKDGIATVKDNPSEYEGVIYQTNMTEWPEDQQKYKLVKRTGSGFEVTAKGEGFTYFSAMYEALPPITKRDMDPKDDFTDSVLATYSKGGYGKARLGTACPGRGDGVLDTPLIKVFGDVDPNDVFQGGVGDCWLLSALSACAEFHGVIERILTQGELSDGWNTYTVTLHDLPSFEEVEYVIDERLMTIPEGYQGAGGLLGCRPSGDGELWGPIIEKAVAAHCGGWNEIEGGNPYYAWKILLGVEDCFLIRESDGGWMPWKESGKLTNRPHDSKRITTTEWPEGGSEALDTDELFHRMCEWDSNNFIMCAGSAQGSGSDKNSSGGIVDSHAYGVLRCVEIQGFQLLELRNPWGKSSTNQNAEFQGTWGDDGPGWSENPGIQDQLDVTFADDGVFWMDKDEFFDHFAAINVCPMNMVEWVGSS